MIGYQVVIISIADTIDLVVSVVRLPNSDNRPFDETMPQKGTPVRVEHFRIGFTRAEVRVHSLSMRHISPAVL